MSCLKTSIPQVDSLLQEMIAAIEEAPSLGVMMLTAWRLVAVLGDIDALQPRLWIESVRQGILTAETVVWLSDGGRGFWRLFRDQFEAHAQGILDFYHAAQNLWKGAKAWLDGRTQRARQWLVLARRKLRRGKADEVLADIQAALALEGLPDSARKTLTNLYNYLDTHRDHIKYTRFVTTHPARLGLPNPSLLAARSGTLQAKSGQIRLVLSAEPLDLTIQRERVSSYPASRNWDSLSAVAWWRVPANGSSNSVSRELACAGARTDLTISSIYGCPGSTNDLTTCSNWLLLPTRERACQEIASLLQ